MKRIQKIILALAVLLVLAGLVYLAFYLKDVTEYKKAVEETTFEEIPLANVSDGVYTGEYDVSFIYAKVEVTVKNGMISEIQLIEHKNERGRSAEAVLQNIKEEQKIDVDAVSGTTNSSTVIKKAVEQALKKGLRKE